MGLIGLIFGCLLAVWGLLRVGFGCDVFFLRLQARVWCCVLDVVDCYKAGFGGVGTRTFAWLG